VKFINAGNEDKCAADQGLAEITAQARHKEDDTGFCFVHCKVNGIGKALGWCLLTQR